MTLEPRSEGQEPCALGTESKPVGRGVAACARREGGGDRLPEVSAVEVTQEGSGA